MVGALLALYAGALLWNADRPRVGRAETRVAVVLNAARVLGSIAVIELGPLTTLGNVAVAAVALAVLGFAVLELVGLRRLRGRSRPACSSSRRGCSFSAPCFSRRSSTRRACSCSFSRGPTTLLPGPADLQLHVVGIAKHDDGDPERLTEIADLAVRDPVLVEDADRVVQRRP